MEKGKATHMKAFCGIIGSVHPKNGGNRLAKSRIIENLMLEANELSNSHITGYSLKPFKQKFHSLMPYFIEQSFAAVIEESLTTTTTNHPLKTEHLPRTQDWPGSGGSHPAQPSTAGVTSNTEAAQLQS